MRYFFSTGSSFSSRFGWFAGGSLTSLLAIFALQQLPHDKPQLVLPPVTDQPKASLKAPVKPESLRFVATELLDLEVQTTELAKLASDLKKGGGAIEAIDGNILIADREGGFFELSSQTGTTPVVRKLPQKLILNSADMDSHLKAIEFPRNVHAVTTRVTDLLLLKGGSPRLAVAYGYWDTEKKCLSLRVSTILVSALRSMSIGSSQEWRLIFDSTPCKLTGSGREIGGRLVQLAENEILLTVGHLDLNSPDDFKTHLDYGKILKINLQSGAVELVSSGHRNPQGLAIGSDGLLWSVEHGPQGGDELNLVEPGKDYGWPHVTLGTQYGNRDWPHSKHQGRHTGFQSPVFSWLPSVGVGNLIEVREFHERWDGDLLVGSMRGNALHRLRRSGEKIVYEERIIINERIRDLIRTSDNGILLWTDSAKLLRVRVPAEKVSLDAKFRAISRDVQTALVACAECHGFRGNTWIKGKISLQRITERRFAIGPSSLYSQAMLDFSKTGGHWNTGLLDRYLTDPEDLIPGTTMAGIRVEDPTTRKGVVEFLSGLR